MELFEMIKSLSEAGGVSGDENDVIEIIKKQIKNINGEVCTDNVGNLIVHINGRNKENKLMVYCHIDESGLVIQSIDENGFLNFSTIGAIEAKDIASQEVYIKGRKKINGLIGLRPPHILSEEERNANVTLQEMNIDCGMEKEEALKYVDIGNTSYVKRDTLELLNSMVCGKALGDRVSAVILIRCIQELCDYKFNNEIYFVFGVQHYNNNAGALAAVERIKPNVAIIIDSCIAKSRDRLSVYQKCGEGIVLYKGPTANTALTNDIEEYAKEKNIKYQILASSGKNPTDTWAIQTGAGGVFTSILMMPVEYKNSSLEKMSLNDLDEGIKLLSGYVKELDSKKWGELLCW